jgi:hypothetical protein
VLTFDFVSSYQSALHSQTFPNMSYKPPAVGRFRPTSWVRPPEFAENQANSLRLRPGSGAAELPRAAYSHSASVGRRYRCPSPREFNPARKVWTSFQLTFSTG